MLWMADAPVVKKRTTLTGRVILAYKDQQVKLFLENGIALDGVLLDYVYDPAERDGVFTLSSQRTDGLPSFVFRRFVTTIQPANPPPARKKTT